MRLCRVPPGEGGRVPVDAPPPPPGPECWLSRVWGVGGSIRAWERLPGCAARPASLTTRRAPLRPQEPPASRLSALQPRGGGAGPSLRLASCRCPISGPGRRKHLCKAVLEGRVRTRGARVPEDPRGPRRRDAGRPWRTLAGEDGGALGVAPAPGGHPGGGQRQRDGAPHDTEDRG